LCRRARQLACARQGSAHGRRRHEHRYSWGLALLRHGNLEGAAQKFAQANAEGPHWADPLKAWGDVLMRENRFKDALAKYDQALKYAGTWKALKAARDTAAKHI
jgi:tetratricopeptide (TPR) repeat protein